VRTCCFKVPSSKVTSPELFPVYPALVFCHFASLRTAGATLRFSDDARSGDCRLSCSRTANYYVSEYGKLPKQSCRLSLAKCTCFLIQKARRKLHWRQMMCGGLLRKPTSRWGFSSCLRLPLFLHRPPASSSLHFVAQCSTHLENCAGLAHDLHSVNVSV